jgi:hypothetical protein
MKKNQYIDNLVSKILTEEANRKIDKIVGTTNKRYEYLTDQKVIKFLNEGMEDELEKLSEYGYSVVESYTAEPYTMLLLHNTEEDIYEISLTTDEDEFTSFESQISKPPKHKVNYVKKIKQLVDKLKDWLKEYGDLFVGSFNKERTYKYKRIFSNMGLNVGEIQFNDNQSMGMPDSYDFMVYASNVENVNENKLYMTEKLHGKQHKLDVAKPKGKITKADFYKLGKRKKSDVTEDDELTDMVVNAIGEQETEEGNAFSGALDKARDEGKKHFTVDGKKYPVKESLRVSESELVDIIEKIVTEQISKKAAGLRKAQEVLRKNKELNNGYTKEVTEKMSKYVKYGSEGKYEPNPKNFPESNDQIKRNKDIPRYNPSEAVEEYIEAFSYPGQTNLRYDEIKPNKDKIKKQLEGDNTTGNATKDKNGNPLGNVVDSEVGEKFMKNFEENLYGIEQAEASYKRVSQPVTDEEGRGTTKGKLKKKTDKILNQLESTTKNLDNLVIEDLRKMKNLISYNSKTQ